MYKYIILFFVVIISIIVFIMININNNIKIKEQDYIIDNLSNVLAIQIDNLHKDAIKTAILISNNKILINSLANKNEEVGYSILHDIVDKIYKITKDKLLIQIITPSKDIFVRSWDNDYCGMFIGDYREDLIYFDTHKNIRSSIEMGRVLTFKTTIPIWRGDIFLGYIEVLNFFDDITSFMKNIGIDFYVLMDDKYLDIAILMRNNDSINNYIIANKNYNIKNKKLLNFINIKNIENGKIKSIKNKYIWSLPILNNNQKILGRYVFVMDTKYIKILSGVNRNILHFLNKDRAVLYNVTSNTMFKEILNQLNLDENVLLNLESVIDKKDKYQYIKVIKSKLEEKSKEDLIQILLNQKQTKEINGVIR